MITLLNQSWTERLGWTLLHFLWRDAWRQPSMRSPGPWPVAEFRRAAAMQLPALRCWRDRPACSPLPVAWKFRACGEVGDLTDWGARRLAPGAAYSPVADPWQQAMPGIVIAWFAGAAACSLRLLMGSSPRRLRRSPPRRRSRMAANARPSDRRMHVSRSVRLLATDRVDSPAVSAGSGQ